MLKSEVKTYLKTGKANMSFIKDFFKSLANNPNVVDDEQVEEELKHFLIENSESSKRVAFLEDSIAVDKDTLKKTAKQAVQKYKTSTSGSSNKVEKEIINDEEKSTRKEKEIGE